MTDPFDTLGTAPRFDLDLSALEQRHRDLSRALHPDRYASAPAAERRLALGHAIEVNEAWRTLRDPVRRAEALLRRAGVPVGETAEPKASQELLIDFLEAREELADAARGKQLARVARLGDAMRVRQQRVEARLVAAFAAAGVGTGGDAAPDRDKLALAVPLLGELRYVRRFLEEVAAIEEDVALTDSP